MPRELTVTATADDGKVTKLKALVRIDTPQELQYYKHGGYSGVRVAQLLNRSVETPRARPAARRPLGAHLLSLRNAISVGMPLIRSRWPVMGFLSVSSLHHEHLSRAPVRDVIQQRRHDLARPAPIA